VSILSTYLVEEAVCIPVPMQVVLAQHTGHVQTLTLLALNAVDYHHETSDKLTTSPRPNSANNKE